MKANTNYLERNLRCIGIMTEADLIRIKNTRVAIGGLGLGGSIFLNLVRMGFEKFHISDPDTYDRTNINRQRGARETTVGCRKDDCLVQEARAINPEVEIETFREGVTLMNVSDFLKGINWVVDAVDVFAIPEKIALHEKARDLKIPVITCVSVGFGAAVVSFNSETPTFGELSGLDKNAPYETNIDRFVRFVTPEVPRYMLEQLGRALKKSSHIPFVVPGMEISAALVCSEICKNLLKIGEPILAPYGVYVDPVGIQMKKFLANYRERST